MSLDLDALRRCHLAVDLGTSSTRVIGSTGELLVDEPSLLAVNTRDAQPIAAGDRARRLEGRTGENVRVLRPIVEGATIDAKLVAAMLRELSGERRLRARGAFRARVAVASRCHAGAEAHHNLKEALAPLGARRVEAVDARVAAAIGCGVPLHGSAPALIVLVGESVTQVALLSGGCVVDSEIVCLGGAAVYAGTMDYFAREFGVRVTRRQLAEAFKTLDTVSADQGDASMLCWDPRAVKMVTLQVPMAELGNAVDGPLTAIAYAAYRVLARSSPDVTVRLSSSGVVLTGGGAGLPGLEDKVGAVCQLPVHVPPNARHSVIRGLGQLIGRS